MTANSFVTLSLRPALVGVSVQPQGLMRGLLEQVRRFGISVLNETQTDYARHYASLGRDNRPRQLHPLLSGDIPPIVPDCNAYFVCEFENSHTVGDHDLIVGSVVHCAVGNPAVGSLIFLDGEFQGIRR